LRGQFWLSQSFWRLISRPGSYPVFRSCPGVTQAVQLNLLGLPVAPYHRD
jgi:hypothetical protein